MKSILESSFIKDCVKVANDMWLKGWDERNGGNISYRIPLQEIQSYALTIDDLIEKEGYDLPYPITNLHDEYFLVTGSGKYFRNIIIDPEDTLGIIKISNDGKKWFKVWGFVNGGMPTSELPTHLLSHSVRKKLSKDHDRVIIHTHATHIIALTYRYKASSSVFTRLLWKMSTECLVVFPDGIGVLPWMVPGSVEIGEATAHLMELHRLVIWPFHGIFGTGSSFDEAFGLIDTAEKAAEILVKVNSMGGVKYCISLKNLRDLAHAFKVKPNKLIF